MPCNISNEDSILLFTHFGFNEEVLNWVKSHGLSFGDGWDICTNPAWLFCVARIVGYDKQIMSSIIMYCFKETLNKTVMKDSLKNKFISCGDTVESYLANSTSKDECIDSVLDMYIELIHENDANIIKTANYLFIAAYYGDISSSDYVPKARMKIIESKNGSLIARKFKYPNFIDSTNIGDDLELATFVRNNLDINIICQKLADILNTL